MAQPLDVHLRSARMAVMLDIHVSARAIVLGFAAYILVASLLARPQRSDARVMGCLATPDCPSNG